MRTDTPPSSLPKVLVGVLIVLLLAVFALWWQRDRLFGTPSSDPQSAAAQPPGPAAGDALPAIDPGALTDEYPSSSDARVAALEESWVGLTGSAPQWPGDFDRPADCQQVEQELLRICRTLDERPYVRDRLRGGGSCALLRQVAEDLAARPPALASELRSFQAMLDNVFHLFRTLGRKRLELVREVMRKEDALSEPMALALYRWLITREQCAPVGQPTAITMEPLYEYAGFLTYTVGGQAYLRRRSPRTEAVTSFYGLMLLDRAIQGQFNPHGIDPRPELRRCRGLIESQPLVFRDRYLERLDAMSRRWQNR